MDKIYSRKRVKLPKIKILKVNNQKNRKKVRLLIILIIAILAFYIAIKSFNPVFDELCANKVVTIATNIINKQSREVLNNYEYNEVVNIVKNETGTNTIIINVAVINKMTSDIISKIEEELQSINKDKLEIPLGAITGNKYLSGVGPKIGIEIVPIGNLETELKTEFKEQGINQTVYRMYLDIHCPIKTLSTYRNTEQNVSGRILLVETLVVGDVPETYYNLNGITEDDTLNVVQ